MIVDILSNSYYRLDGHMEKGRAVSKTRAAYDRLLGTYIEMKKKYTVSYWTHRRPVCQPMAMGRMVLHDDAKAAQFDWKFLEIYGFGP